MANSDEELHQEIVDHVLAEARRMARERWPAVAQSVIDRLAVPCCEYDYENPVSVAVGQSLSDNAELLARLK